MRWLFGLAAASLAACPLRAETHPIDLAASAGYACVPDSGLCDRERGSGQILAGVWSRLYFTHRWAFQPEIEYMNNTRTRGDYLQLMNFTVDLGSHERVKPYLIFGGGLIVHDEYRIRTTHYWTAGAGYGVKTYAWRNIFISPELRFGWGAFLSLRVGAGYTFGRR